MSLPGITDIQRFGAQLYQQWINEAKAQIAKDFAARRGQVKNARRGQHER